MELVIIILNVVKQILYIFSYMLFLTFNVCVSFTISTEDMHLVKHENGVRIFQERGDIIYSVMKGRSAN